MIQKLSDPGKGFGGVLRYDLQPSKDAQIIAGNVRGQDAGALAREFSQWRDLNPRVTLPVFHGSLSAAPGDVLAEAAWRDVAERYIQKMRYQDSPWIAIRHADTDDDHIHIIASRIRNDGKRVKDFQEIKRGEEACRQIEREMGLTRVAPSRESSRRAVHRGELATFERTARVGVVARLQEHVTIAARDRPTVSDFVARLEAQGVEVKANIATTGRVAGISFALDGVAVKGSDLGRAFSWQALQQRQGVRYEPDRDLPSLRDASSRTQEITSRVPTPAEPAAGVPTQQRPVEAYRHAAVLESRADLEERGNQLAEEQDQARATIDYVQRWIGDQHHLDATLGHVSGTFRDAFSEIYQDPPAAYRELESLRAGRGAEIAAATLRQSPAAFGRLRGLGAGRMVTETRRDALAAAPRAASAFREATDLMARIEERERSQPGAVDALHTAKHRAESLYAAREHLQLPGLREDILRSARALGEATVKVLSAGVVRAVQSGTLTAARTLGRGLARGLGFGRDDGLGR